MGPRVIVIGGGIGGLALAQGLRRGGVDVVVYERDPSPSDRLQGYRVHINTDGSRALHACLPPVIFDAFLATCGQPNTGIGISTHLLRELIWFGGQSAAGDSGPVEGVKSASRVSLRQVLLAGLAEAIHFGKTFTGYERNGDGRVTAHFADGTKATGDVLVGADGGNSRVRQQYLPHAGRIDTGVGPEAAAQRDYVMWGLLTRRALLPANLEELDPAALRSLALTRIQAWHPTLRRLVAVSDLKTVLLTSIRSSVPVGPWSPTNVTLLGDAIHSMPPTGGIGANTALRDAALLAGKLTAVAGDALPLIQAIGQYENEMRGYGFEAVRSSMRNLRQQQRTESPLALAGMKIALRTLNAIPALKRHAFK